MRETFWERLRFYIVLWTILFIGLCIVSVAINWNAFLAEIGNAISSVLVTVATIAVVIGIIVSLIMPR